MKIKKANQMELSQEELNKALIKAIQKEKEDLTAELLVKGADPNYIQKTENIRDTTYPLKECIKTDNLKILNLLIKAKVNVNGVDSYDPLLYCIYHNRLNCFKTLVENGANCHKVHLLHEAISRTSIPMVEYLMTQKVDANAKDYRGVNGLFICAYQINPKIDDETIKSDYLKIAEILIQNGADINCVDNTNLTPLTAAIIFNNPEMVELLIKNKAEINNLSFGAILPMNQAIKSENKTIIRLLYKNGADLFHTGGVCYLEPGQACPFEVLYKKPEIKNWFQKEDFNPESEYTKRMWKEVIFYPEKYEAFQKKWVPEALLNFPLLTDDLKKQMMFQPFWVNVISKNKERSNAFMQLWYQAWKIEPKCITKWQGKEINQKENHG